MLIGIGSQYFASVPRPATCAGSLYPFTNAWCNPCGEADCSNFSALYVSLGTLGKSAHVAPAISTPHASVTSLNQGFINICFSPLLRNDVVVSGYCITVFHRIGDPIWQTAFPPCIYPSF